MKALFLLLYVTKVFSFNTAPLKSAFVGTAVTHLNHPTAFTIPRNLPTESRAILEMTAPEREVTSVASAIANNLYQYLPKKDLSKPIVASNPVQSIERVEATRGRFRKIKEGFKASLSRPPINFGDIIFDEASQTYTIPAALMEPYKQALISARKKVKEEESAKFLMSNPEIAKFISQGALENVFTVGLEVLCILLNSPIQPISNFVVNKLSGMINAHPTPEIAEKFFRGQCNHAGIEHSLWLKKMTGKFPFKI
jgi:hypothetical protein